MNLKGMAYKLQTALCHRGRYIKINQVQAYSTKTERMVTKYLIIENIYDEEEQRKINVTLLETYSLSDVVKKLADIYGGG